MNASIIRKWRTEYATAIFFSFISAAALTKDIPEEEFTAARVSLKTAQELDAKKSAVDELLLAEQKIQLAVLANNQHEEVKARRLLEESILHSRYVDVAARYSIAKESLDEINSNLATRNTELEKK